MSPPSCYSYFFNCCICQYYNMLFLHCLLLMRFKYINYSFHFHELDYRGLSLNFLRLKQLLIDGNKESNPGPTQNLCKSPVGRLKKIKCLNEQQKSVVLVKTMVMLLVIQMYKLFFQYNSTSHLRQY